MLVFGHAGITLGAAVILARVLRNSRLSNITKKDITESSPRPSQVIPTPNGFPGHKVSWLNSMVNHTDTRLLLIGSLLPDIIDKPLGWFFLRETFSNGRIFCHTLLLLILVTVAGLYFYRHHGKTWLLAFSFGTLTHLMFDQMWYAPHTLLWPVLGISFERSDITRWVENTTHNLLADPAVFVPELVGAAILVWFVLGLVFKRRLSAFIKYGQAS